MTPILPGRMAVDGRRRRLAPDLLIVTLPRRTIGMAARPVQDALVTLTRRASSVQVAIPSTMSVISTGPVS